MVHRAANGRISVHWENTTSPYSRGTSSLNFSTIVWGEISKLVKSVLSYLFMLHPPPTESPRIVDNFMVKNHVVLSRSLGFTPSRTSVSQETMKRPQAHMSLNSNALISLILGWPSSENQLARTGASEREVNIIRDIPKDKPPKMKTAEILSWFTLEPLERKDLLNNTHTHKAHVSSRHAVSRLICSRRDRYSASLRPGRAPGSFSIHC